MKDSNEEVEFAPEEIIDPIEVISTATCESLSGRSDLTFDIGRHTEDGNAAPAHYCQPRRGWHVL
jgi:hypothetical protein